MLLDSCAHPTCDGRWLGGRLGATAGELAADLKRSGFTGALAIGLPGVGGYEHERFLDACAGYPSLIPVAALTSVASPSTAAADLAHVALLGYRIVKIHPRLLGYERTLEALDDLVGEAAANDLAVALCTYPEYRSSIDPDRARARMAESLARVPDAWAIALHTGVLDSRPFAALTPTNPRLLLDFSLSLLRYSDKVRPQVISIAAERPGCVALGSDGPEWSYAQVRNELAALDEELSPEAHDGLAGANLRTWLAGVGVPAFDDRPG